MRIAVKCAFAATLIAAAHLCGAQQNPQPGAEIAGMQRVPLESLYRVTRADGQVFYVSGDRRWLFHGKLMDMWTGQDEKEMEVYDEMSWERSGFSPPEVSLGVAEEAMSGVLFVSRECDDCIGLLSEIQNKALNIGIATIPPKKQRGEAETRSLWCNSGETLALARNWIQNSRQKKGNTCDRSDSVGKIQAMVEVYGLDRSEPTYIETSGRIHRGHQKIVTVWSEK